MQHGLKNQLLIEGARMRLIAATKDINELRALAGLPAYPLDDVKKTRKKGGNGHAAAPLADKGNRKRMSSAARKAVSTRMKAYWAKKRKE